MKRLIALVLLRWRLELRAFTGARERILGLALVLPGLVVASSFVAFLVFAGVTTLGRAQPEALLPVASAVVTFFGVMFCLQPFFSGVAFTETHDLRHLIHFPIPFPVLAASSLLANLLQPMVLSELPVSAAFALAVAGPAPSALPAFAGALLSLLAVLGAAQAMGFLLQTLTRRRRLRELLLSFGILLGFLASLVPFLLLSQGGSVLSRLMRGLTRHDVFSLSPFAWGVRAAIHAGRGEWTAFGLCSMLSLTFTASCMFASSLLVARIYRGEVEVGVIGERQAPARMPFAGSIGALVEKDLRSAWRDPALRSLIVVGLASPLLLLFFLSQAGRGGRGGSLVLLAVFVGLSSFGGNVLGFERRGIGLLLSFPVARWRVLLSKNLAIALLRLPNFCVVVVAAIFLASPSILPAVVVALLATVLIATGADNYLSILFPTAAPAPGQSPHAGAAGARGLAAMAVSALFLTGAMALAAPFVFLAWLPQLLERPGLGLLTLPLAVAGAASVYAMLLAGAARLFERREPELLERILVEA